MPDQSLRSVWHQWRHCRRNLHEWIRPRYNKDLTLVDSLGKALTIEPEERVCRWCGDIQLQPQSYDEGVTKIGDFGEPEGAWVITTNSPEDVEPQLVMSMTEARETFTLGHIRDWHFRKNDGSPGCDLYGDQCPGRMVK